MNACQVPQTWRHRSLRPLYQGSRPSNDRGSLLAQVLVSLAIVGVAFSVLLTGLSTGSMAVLSTDIDVTAKTLARNQLESVFSGVYIPPPAVYPTIIPPPGYTVTAEAQVIEATDPDIERIIVTVYRDGNMELMMETTKANR